VDEVRSKLARLACGGAALAVGLWSGACSSPAPPLGSGAQCLQTTDCRDGLVCVPGTNNGPKTCSSNLMNTVSTEEAGTVTTRDGGVGDGAAAADGARPGDAGTPGTSDAAVRDAQSLAPEAAAPDAATGGD
jgi:hypothetical protein